MDSLDYKELYALQDKVLEAVFASEQIFYLTGGTCLSRFYLEKRYSNDLDFFTNNTREFNRGIREIRDVLNKRFDVLDEISSRDFVRLKINGLLQVDFINDRVPRYKEPVHLDNGYIIDNCENILANKLTAVIGRDNPKDIFDIYLLNSYQDPDWKEILDVAHQKAEFYNDDLIIRLKTFPISLLKHISLTDTGFLDNFTQEYLQIIEKIEDSIQKSEKQAK